MARCMLTRNLHCVRKWYNVQYNCSPIPPPQVERFGDPTWRRLASAVADRIGGNNLALARNIAREHPGSFNTTSLHWSVKNRKKRKKKKEKHTNRSSCCVNICTELVTAFSSSNILEVAIYILSLSLQPTLHFPSID